jgi:VIT1/CCC1 family predicted Fe2+/Mn2+ transporter
VNIVLWALQVILALKFASVTYTHGLRLDPAKMERGMQRLGAVARPLLILVGLGTFLGAMGLILPAAIGVLPWLTPLSAAVLALMMLCAIGFHLVCRERAKTIVDVVLFTLAALLAYGRWVIAPF